MSPVVIIGIAVLLIIAVVVVLMLRKTERPGGDVRKELALVFEQIEKQSDFEDVAFSSSQTKALVSCFNSHHMSSVDFKENILDIVLCLKKTEPFGDVYLSYLKIVRSEGSGIPEFILNLFVNLNMKAYGKLFIRPKMSDFLEEAFKYALARHPDLKVKPLPNTIHDYEDMYSSFLLNMTPDAGKRIMPGDVQRILVKHASGFPMNSKSEEVPSVLLAGHSLFITCTPTIQKKHLEELITLGRELGAAVHEQVKDQQ